MNDRSNLNSIYTTLGASNHTAKERQADDYYATEPKAAELLLEQEEFHHTIWECACGEGHLAKVFQAHGHEVIATDLIYRGYGDPEPLDFLTDTLNDFEGDIITNPPYKYAQEFVQKALESVKDGRKVAMFLKLQFLEGKARKELFQKTPPPNSLCFKFKANLRHERRIRKIPIKRSCLCLVRLGEGVHWGNHRQVDQLKRKVQKI